MNLNEYLQKRPRGELLRISRAIGAHAPDVSRWSSGDRPIPVNKVVAIEQATNGEVTRKDLRPDDWERIWPELSEKEGA